MANTVSIACLGHLILPERIYVRVALRPLRSDEQTWPTEAKETNEWAYGTHEHEDRG